MAVPPRVESLHIVVRDPPVHIHLQFLQRPVQVLVEFGKRGEHIGVNKMIWSKPLA